MSDYFGEPATLILIDVQQGLDNPWFGQRNNPDAERNIEALLAHWRAQDWLVIHVQHASNNPKSPLHETQSGFQLKEGFIPREGEMHFVKRVNSAFVNTGLGDYLQADDRKALVFCGLTTEHCVSTSVRHAGNLGFDVTLAADATASFDSTDHNGKYFSAEQVYDVSLATLNEEFCSIVNTADIT